MTNSKRRYYTAEVYCDSTGKDVIPSYAKSVSDVDLAAENNDRKRRLDERQRKQDIRDCDQNIYQRKLDAYADSLAERENSLLRKIRVDGAIRKMLALHARMDAIEQEEQEARLNDPEAELTLPPGFDQPEEIEEPALEDSGDMEPIKPSEPEDREQLTATEEDDEGPGDLPKSLTEKIPPETGTDPDLSGAREPEYRNPAAPSW